MSSRADDIKKVAQAVLKDPSKMSLCIDNLKGDSRSVRQSSASVVAEVARHAPDMVAPFSKELIDALELPEAQTRWEALDALTEICPQETRACDKAINGAEAALFDENSGPLRLAAMRFLCTLGATTENRSEKVWDLIDEGIQCYHGDIEFNEMLQALVDFSAGNLSPEVKKQFSARMKFDSTNGRGILKKRAIQIEENLSSKK